MKPYTIVRCPSHSSMECWIVRRWQAATDSYVFENSFEDKQDAIDKYGE